MKYETANAFRTALEQRLKNEAQASGIALIRLRKRVAFIDPVPRAEAGGLWDPEHGIGTRACSCRGLSRFGGGSPLPTPQRRRRRLPSDRRPSRSA